MARTRSWTRESAIEYLAHSANYLALRSANPRIDAPRDLSTTLAKRYASRAYQYEQEGKWAVTLAEWRGHTGTEHHRQRPPKRAIPDWYEGPSPRIPRGRFDQPLRARSSVGAGATVPGYVRITSYEGTAVKELMEAAARDQVVYINLSGPEKGEYARLFSKGGYRAELLLHEAGYRRDLAGKWHRPHGPGRGLEEWLLDYLANHPGPNVYRQGHWGVIKLYEIFVEELDIPDKRRRKTQPWPAPQARQIKRLADEDKALGVETLWEGGRRKAIIAGKKVELDREGHKGGAGRKKLRDRH